MVLLWGSRQITGSISLNMFIGEVAVWIVYFYQVWEKRWQQRQPIPPSATQQLDAARLVDDIDDQIAKEGRQQELKGSKAFLFWIPTLCDMAATTVRVSHSPLFHLYIFQVN